MTPETKDLIRARKYDIVQRHDDDGGEIFYEIMDTASTVQIYVHGPNAKNEADKICERMNTAPPSVPASGVGVEAKSVERLWRDCGLPEYFLGNGGTNHALYKFAEQCAVKYAIPPAPVVPDFIREMRLLKAEMELAFTHFKNGQATAGIMLLYAIHGTMERLAAPPPPAREQE